jgi:hypothetical protein
MRLLALAVAAAALQAPPKTRRATRLAATQQQLDVGCWMLLVPELNALPGRHAYDQTEFLNTDEILDRVDSIDEAAVLSTCDRYCVFVATKKNLTEALRDVETVVSREIAVRAGRTGRQLLLPHAEGGAQAIAAPEPLPQQAVAGALDDSSTQRMLADAFEQVRARRAAAGDVFAAQVANHADHFQGDVDALAAALVEEPETARRRQICEVTTKARPTREDTTLTAQQEARLEERAQKRAAREEAKLLKKAEIFKELGFAKERENCERFALRLGAGLESTIVGDLTIPRQLLELRDETLKSGATPRRGVLLPLIDAARAAGRKTRDETLGDLSIARFPSREDTMSADEASAVLDHARAVVDAEHAQLLESRLERRAAPLIRAFRARADALVARCANSNARLVARRLLHAPTLKLRGDPADADAVVEDALRRVEVALDALPP